MHVAIIALLAAAASVSALSNPHRRAAEVLRRRPAVTINAEVDLQRRDESLKPQFLTSKTERGFSIQAGLGNASVYVLTGCSIRCERHWYPRRQIRHWRVLRGESSQYTLRGFELVLLVLPFAESERDG